MYMQSDTHYSCVIYPEEASKETSRKHDCRAFVKYSWHGRWGIVNVVVLIDCNSCVMQNKPHCSEVDNTEDSYLLSVVKEAICNHVYTCVHACI